ncbi:MAG: MFS transporter [Acidimicrobiia bacterium]|nr:MFS transporter [Acidimicrobiia bacterium]MBT8194098.1 MFS transporter [Acidimicrobiia bacterium]NNL13342.1 MFS transporter [Acidimicrobiia bacterium]
MKRTPSPPLVMAAVAFGVFVAADDLTVVSTLLRQIIGDLEIPLPSGFDDAAWIVNSYLIAYVAVMPFMGRLSDLLGRRKVYVGALVVFLIGSAWIPFTSSLGWFIAARVLTAIGGGAMVPVALAVIGDLYPEARRPRAYGILGAVDTIGWVWGPLFGALLVRFLDWRWQFYLNVPLALLGMAAAWWALQDHDKPSATARIDWPGAGALTLGLVSLNIALLDAGEISVVGDLSELTGEGSTTTTWLFGVAALAFALFWWIERRRADPLIDLSLFTGRNFAAGVGVNFLVGAVLIVAMVDVPLFVNLVVETSLQDAAVLSGWVLSGLTAAMAVTSYLGGVATERTWYRPVIVVGLLVTGLGFLVVGGSWDADVGPWTMGWQLVILGIGFGLVTAPTNAAVVDAAPAGQRGTAAGLVIVSRLMGLAVGLSGLTAWTLYRFDRLRSDLDLPGIGDPGYQDALEAATADITAQSLTETFLFAVVVVAAGLLVAMGFRRTDRPIDTRE